MIEKIISEIKSIILKAYSFDDRVNSWQEATEVTEGYDSDIILNKVVSSHLKAQGQNNSYERDSVVLEDNLINWPLVGMLYWTAKNISEKIKVLDLGGSFASAFFQNMRVLSALDIKWMVVEQQHFVDAAKKIVDNPQVSFFFGFENLLKNEKPNVAHFGSSLQYLETPYEVIKSVQLSDVSVLIIDRIPVHSGSEDLVVAQRVPREIYDSSYPAWIFSEEKLINFLSQNWILLSEFESIGGSSRTFKRKKFSWQGYIFISKKYEFTV